MPFDLDKKHILSRKDKSKAQEIDRPIRRLVGMINSHPDCYTTSSCAGRIQLIIHKGRKCDSYWLYKSHEKATFEEVREAVDRFKGKGQLWFRQEAMILHVCCRTLEQAKRLLNMARTTGFNRSGIITAGRRVIVEITSPEKVDTVIGVDGKIVVDDNYLRLLINTANSKLISNQKRIKEFEKLFLSG